MRTILVLTGGSKTDEQVFASALAVASRWALILTSYMSESPQLRQSAIRRTSISREVRHSPQHTTR